MQPPRANARGTMCRMQLRAVCNVLARESTKARNVFGPFARAEAQLFLLQPSSQGDHHMRARGSQSARCL
eukprot:9021676-Lingulodinium_polyedra.AAC.1